MIYKCKKCKNYVDDRNMACVVCGTPAEKKEYKSVQMAPIYGRSDEAGAVSHMERYSKFLYSSFDYVGEHAKWRGVSQCGNFLYILAGNGSIYKFDMRQYLKNRTNQLTAVDILTIDLQEYWGVNREGVWSWSVSETEESTRVMLFEEQGILRGKASIKSGRLQYIYGTKLYFSSEDGRVAQFDILNKTSKIVWDFRKEPYYSELEKIRRSQGLKTPKFTTSFHGIAANENYVIVRYETYYDDDEDDSLICYIEPTKKIEEVTYSVEACNISCCDLNTGEQTLLYGGEGYVQVENGEEVIAEEYLYGPFGIVRGKEDYNGRVTDAEGRCAVIGMDMASNEIYFLWRGAGDGEWQKKIYSASIRDFLIREVEKNKVLCWELDHDYSCGNNAGQYFCGEYFYGDIAHNDNEKMVILGRGGSRVALAYVDDCHHSVLDCTAGAWIYGYRDSDGCFQGYLNHGDFYTLFAIDTRPLSAERCLHINEDELTKTKADLTAVQDDCKKQKRLVAESDDEDDWIKIPAESDGQNDRNDVSEETDRGAMVSVDYKSASQLEYWEGFSSYAESFGLNPAMTMAKLAERTWQALRMKPSFLRIECSFSVRKNSLRTAFIVEGYPEVFTQAESARGEIDRELQGYDVTWDGKSSAANISLTTSREGMNTPEQYNWFCRAAEALYEAIRPRLDI